MSLLDTLRFRRALRRWERLSKPMPEDIEMISMPGDGGIWDRTLDPDGRWTWKLRHPGRHGIPVSERELTSRGTLPQ